ncbi:MAG TPA: hypothetical protein VF834_18470 [Streptosporangiaceae bacterium]
MGVSQDEQVVRQLLADVTADQPYPPSDRHRQVLDRAASRRRPRMAAAVVGLAALAGVAFGLGTSAGSGPTAATSRHVPAWALPWPDHGDGSVPPRVLDSAVAAWRHGFAHMQSTQPTVGVKAPLIWYVGQTTADGQAVVVMFEVDTVTGPRLVAGWATASEVMPGHPPVRGGSPWVLYDVPAPKPKAGLTIGLNVHGQAARPGRSPSNWIVVLAAPQVRQVVWTASPASGPAIHGSLSVIGTTSRGLVAGPAGPLTGPVNLIALYDAAHRNLLARHAWVGVPGSRQSYVPQLVTPGPVIFPPGFNRAVELRAQGTQTDELPGRPGRLAFVARCYGPVPLRLAYSLQIGTPGKSQVALGTIPCDNGVHELVTRIRPRPGGSFFLTIRTSWLTAYRLVQGTVGR